MKKPNALVFFDLDGTLLTSRVEVANKSILAIKELKQKNILPLIATGRCPSEVKHIMKQTGIDSLISMNGQSVFLKDKNIYSNDISVSEIDAIYNFAKTKHISLGFYNENTIKVSEHNIQVEHFYRHQKEAIPLIDVNFYKNHAIQMLVLLCEAGESHFIDVFPKLMFIRNTPFGVDVFNKGGSKANVKLG